MAEFRVIQPWFPAEPGLSGKRYGSLPTFTRPVWMKLCGPLRGAGYKPAFPMISLPPMWPKSARTFFLGSNNLQT